MLAVRASSPSTRPTSGRAQLACLRILSVFSESQQCFPEIFVLVSSSEWCPRPYKSDKGIVATEKRNYGPLTLGTDMAG